MMSKSGFENYLLDLLKISVKASKTYLNELDKFLQGSVYHKLLPSGKSSIYDIQDTQVLDDIYEEILNITKNGDYVRSALNHYKKYIKNVLASNSSSSNIKVPVIPDFYNNLINLLKANYNLILSGAPGTGKTYIAKQIASYMNARKSFVQFHPSYDYTDFVEGLRPISDVDKISDRDTISEIKFQRVDGIFMDFCRLALENSSENSSEDSSENSSEDSSNPCVFIIDEINRGEISKILGELFFAIDPGYRGEKGKVKTQYNNLMKPKDEFKDGFYIPENVYIIGTMNDIDRSVDSFDFAVRRRFAWKEIKAEDTAKDIILASTMDQKLSDSLVKVMNQVNHALEEDTGLSSDYHLGGAYFAKISQYINGGHNPEDAMQLLWNYHLEGVIKEYFRGLPDAIDKVDKIRKVYDNESKKMFYDTSTAVSVDKSSALDELSNNVTDLSLESTDGKSDDSESNDSK